MAVNSLDRDLLNCCYHQWGWRALAVRYSRGRMLNVLSSLAKWGASQFCIYSASVPEERVQYALRGRSHYNQKNPFCKTEMLPQNVVAGDRVTNVFIITFLN